MAHGCPGRPGRGLRVSLSISLAISLSRLALASRLSRLAARPRFSPSRLASRFSPLALASRFSPLASRVSLLASRPRFSLLAARPRSRFRLRSRPALRLRGFAAWVGAWGARAVSGGSRRARRRPPRASRARARRARCAARGSARVGPPSRTEGGPLVTLYARRIERNRVQRLPTCSPRAGARAG